MADQNDQTGRESDPRPAGLERTRRALHTTAGAKAPATRMARRVRRAAAHVRVSRPVRRFAVVGVIAALVGTAAIPAFAAAGSTTPTRTVQQLAADDAQSVVVASAQETATLARSSYSATTAEEVAQKKAAEAAAERARQAQAAAASYTPANIDLSMVGPGTGAIRWPLAHINHIGEGFMARGGEHQGVDLLTDGGTPIFAATSGVVRVSSEGYYGYGVAITIETQIGGHTVTTLYGHMQYGSRQVQSGQSVSVGQVIGLVGSTGRSTANHLHFEVNIDGGNVDPLAWLQANAG